MTPPPPPPGKVAPVHLASAAKALEEILGEIYPEHEFTFWVRPEFLVDAPREARGCEAGERVDPDADPDAHGTDEREGA